MSFFLDDPKEAKKLQKYLQAKIKDVRLINLDKDGGDEANFDAILKACLDTFSDPYTAGNAIL